MEKISTQNQTEKQSEFSHDDFNYYNQLRSDFMTRVGPGEAYNIINKFVDQLSDKNGGLDDVRRAFLFHPLVGSTLDGTEEGIDKNKKNPINQEIANWLEEKAAEK